MQDLSVSSIETPYTTNGLLVVPVPIGRQPMAVSPVTQAPEKTVHVLPCETRLLHVPATADRWVMLPNVPIDGCGLYEYISENETRCKDW